MPPDHARLGAKALSPDYPGPKCEPWSNRPPATPPASFCKGTRATSRPATTTPATLRSQTGMERFWVTRRSRLSRRCSPPRTRLTYARVVESGAPLATWELTPQAPSEVLRVKLVEVEYELKSLPAAAEIERQMTATDDRVMKERLLRKSRVRRIVGDGTTARVPLWVWRLGDADISRGAPNEAYSGCSRTCGGWRATGPSRR